MVTIFNYDDSLLHFVGIATGGVVGAVSDGVERAKPQAEWWMRWAWHAWLKTIP